MILGGNSQLVTSNLLLRVENISRCFLYYTHYLRALSGRCKKTTPQGLLSLNSEKLKNYFSGKLTYWVWEDYEEFIG
jgi:hypothetical protein